MRLRVVLPVCLLVALAGCLGEGGGPSPEREADPGPTAATQDPGPVPNATTDASVPTEDVPVEDEADPPALLVYRVDGHWDQETAAFVMGPSDGASTLRFPVTPDGEAVLVELAWNGSQDIDPVLYAPRDCYEGTPSIEGSLQCGAAQARFDGSGGNWWNWDGAREEPDATATIAVDRSGIEAWGCAPPATGDDACEWRATVWGKDVNEDLAWHLFVTVSYEGPLPADYTAVPW